MLPAWVLLLASSAWTDLPAPALAQQGGSGWAAAGRWPAAQAPRPEGASTPPVFLPALPQAAQHQAAAQVAQLPLPPRGESQQPPAEAPANGTGFRQTVPPASAPPTLPGPGLGRVEHLPELPPGLRTPQPSPEVVQRYGQFVQRTIDPEVALDLVVGRPRILTFRQPPRRMYLPDESVARLEVLDPNDPREIAITGLRTGSTVLHIWVPDPQAPQQLHVLSYLLRVIADPERKERLDAIYEALAREINRAFPDSYVELTLVGDQIVVRGQAKDAFEAAHILRIVEQNAPRQSREPGAANVNFNVSQTSFLPSGVEQTESLTGLPADVLRSAVLQTESGIVNLLRIPGEQQVMLRVTVAEVNRSAARSIGLNFSITNDSGLTVFQSLTGPLTGNNLPTLLDNGQVALAINALRNLKLARTLAEPNLVTLNGRTANFQAGGQFPIPVVTGFTAAGLQGVQFVPFGVQLQFTPYILDRDRVRLIVSANVSTRDQSLGTNIGGAASAGGTNVPGLNTRNFQTTVELREGQTLAVAGLIQTNFGADSDRVPLWGDLPIIGRTGGFDRTSAGEQELVILITPELVHPLEACHTPPLPGNDVFEPGDLEFYLQGRLESRRSYDFRSTVRTDYHRLRRYHDCQDVFIIGPHGHSFNCCQTPQPLEPHPHVPEPPRVPVERLPAAPPQPAPAHPGVGTAPHPTTTPRPR
jgi:pilus assembly protein CpaC